MMLCSLLEHAIHLSLILDIGRFYRHPHAVEKIPWKCFMGDIVLVFLFIYFFFKLLLTVWFFSWNTMMNSSIWEINGQYLLDLFVDCFEGFSFLLSIHQFNNKYFLSIIAFFVAWIYCSIEYWALEFLFIYKSL